MTDLPDAVVEAVAEASHIAYEDAALEHGWETQKRSRVPWADVPEENKATVRVAIRAALAAASGPWAEQLSTVLPVDPGCVQWQYGACRCEAECPDDRKDALAAALARNAELEAERDGWRKHYEDAYKAYSNAKEHRHSSCIALEKRRTAQCDALRAELDNLRNRVNALADEWDGKARMATDQANAMSSDRRQPYLMDSAKYLRRASELRAIVRGSDDAGEDA